MTYSTPPRALWESLVGLISHNTSYIYLRFPASFHFSLYFTNSHEMVAHQLNQWASHNTKSNTEKSNLLHREHDKTNNTLVDESIFHSTLPAQKICAHALDHDQERDRPRFWYLLGIFSLFAWGACLGIYVLYAVENSGKEDQQDRRGIFGNYRITFTVVYFYPPSYILVHC